MKKTHEFKGYYAIYGHGNEPIPATIRLNKGNCIKQWVHDSGITWNECRKKYGWSCKKINILIKPA